MIRYVFIILFSIGFIFSAIAIYAESTQIKTAQPLDVPTISSQEKTKDRASRAMNNILYGPLEVPKNIDETGTKGTAIDNCSQKTKSGVERGIARVVTGAWQLATFWYSDPGCVTSSKSAGSSNTDVITK